MSTTGIPSCFKTCMFRLPTIQGSLRSVLVMYSGLWICTRPVGITSFCDFTRAHLHRLYSIFSPEACRPEPLYIISLLHLTGFLVTVCRHKTSTGNGRIMAGGVSCFWFVSSASWQLRTNDMTSFPGTWARKLT